MASTSRVPVDELLRRLSVSEYDAMIAAGIFSGDDRIELLEGYLVEKMTKSPAHSAATRLTRILLARLVGPGWYVDAQEPITTGDSEPEPDVAVVRGGPRDHLERHPSASEVGLVVEVADASLRRDRETKARVYGRAGIPVYWIINVAARTVEVHTEPHGDGYARSMTATDADDIPLVLDGVRLAEVVVSDMLP